MGDVADTGRRPQRITQPKRSGARATRPEGKRARDNGKQQIDGVAIGVTVQICGAPLIGDPSRANVGAANDGTLCIRIYTHSPLSGRWTPCRSMAAL